MSDHETEALRIVILGAAGRDFHLFNTLYRDDPAVEVVAFTAQQIPHIADRRYPPELAGERYPDGIPIVDEAMLEELVLDEEVDACVLGYSDLSYVEVGNLASRANSVGASFVLPDPWSSMLEADVPVVAVCAVRTGAGKSQTSRAVVRTLRDAGLEVAVIRHPMPYGDLVKQRVQRFADMDDLVAHDVTIEEREEYEPHLAAGSTVWAGVDYEQILEAAQAEADVIVWDGGNNDTPFLAPDLWITLVDPHRPGHETSYQPGETNLRLADVVIVNKVDTADPAAVGTVLENVRRVNPEALVLQAASPIVPDDPQVLAGRRVLAVEDGPTCTHGGMRHGAGMLGAQAAGAAAIVDPRPFAVGELADTYARYPGVGPVLPAMGYGPAQIADLEATIRRAFDADAIDAVAIGTPIDLARLVTLPVPSTRCRYELEIREGPSLADVLAPLIDDARADARGE